MDYIRHLLQITRVPAFTPYFWFFTTNLLTVQAILIILSYLKHNPLSQDAQIGRYFVDEALEILETSDISTRHATWTNGDPSVTAESEQGPPAVWRLLKTMRMELDTPAVQKTAVPAYPQFTNSIKMPGSNGRDSMSGSPAAAFFPQKSQHASTASSFSLNNQQIPQVSSGFSTNDMFSEFDLGSIPSYLGGVAGDQPPSGLGTGLDISDLDSWSSIILQSSEDLPPVRDF